MSVVDRRNNGRSKGSESRKRFIKRYQKALSKKVDDFIRNNKIKDLDKADKVKAKGKVKDIVIKHPIKDKQKDPKVVGGNTEHSKKDEIAIPKRGVGQRQKPTKQGDPQLSEDEFEFLLNKEEFRDLLFQGMEIPNFFKKSGKGETIDYLKKAGYTKRGIPGRLLVKKTYEQAIARCLNEKDREEDDEIELDDIDLRYRNYITKTDPVRKAIVFCVMDVSASMGQEQKDMAKKFYYMLYLFLTTKYQEVELVFVKYTHEAKEVDEEEFFHSRESGGTRTLSALNLVDEIINERYDLNTDNIYLSLVSDGGEFDPEDVLVKFREIMHKFNYVAYMEVPELYWTFTGFSPYGGNSYLIPVFEKLKKEYEDQIGYTAVEDQTGIYRALRDLFEAK